MHLNQHSYNFQNAAAYASLSMISVTHPMWFSWLLEVRGSPARALFTWGNKKKSAAAKSGE